MGSENSVSAAAEKALEGVAETVRFDGADRYETSQLTAEWALENGLVCKNPVLTIGWDGKFTDALVASSLGGKNESPLLLINEGEAMNLQIEKVLEPNKADIEKAYVIGDEKSVSKPLYEIIEKALA